MDYEPYIRTPAEDALFDRLAPGKTVRKKDIPEVAREIMANIGSPDPELRDDRAYAQLVDWIVEDEALESDLLSELGATALSGKGLRHRLEDVGGFGVFRRSFSALVLALVVHADQQRPFLTDEQWDGLVEGTAAYCRNEMDFRGFVPEHGWAHAVAHAADLVDECVRSHRATVADVNALADALFAMIDHVPIVFANEEEDRVANALVGIVGTIELATLCERIDWEADNGEPVLRTNWKHIVRSLYFRLDNTGDENDEDARGAVAALQLKLTTV